MKPPEFPELFVEDGTDRYYLRGELRERPHRFRTRDEGITVARLTYRLAAWEQEHYDLGGEVLVDMGYRLRDRPPTAPGIPVSLLGPVAARDDPRDRWWVYGRPELAVEILRHDEPVGLLGERVAEYLACGVPLVWVADPLTRSITAHRPGADPELLREGDRVGAAPELPGFSCPVAGFFR
jgi:hypothetical protein